MQYFETMVMQRNQILYGVTSFSKIIMDAILEGLLEIRNVGSSYCHGSALNSWRTTILEEICLKSQA